MATLTRYSINVTKKDIESCRVARQGDPRRCMISDAVQRAVPTALHIDTDLRYLRFSLDKTQRRYFYDLPRIAMQALVDFDGGKTVEPFKFNVSRGFSVKRRSKLAGYKAKPKNPNAKKTRRQPPRKREFGLHAFTK